MKINKVRYVAIVELRSVELGQGDLQKIRQAGVVKVGEREGQPAFAEPEVWY